KHHHVNSTLPIFTLLDPAPTDIYSLSLHDALPIFLISQVDSEFKSDFESKDTALDSFGWCYLSYGTTVYFSERDFNDLPMEIRLDRKSTRLNTSHVKISYAVFCLKKKLIKR